MASMEQPDPATVRKQRSSFLASLSRSVSPPPGTINAPHPVVRDGDLELAPRKRRRLSMDSGTPTELNSGERQLIPSPFQLTKIQDLPNAENLDTVTLHDLLGNPLISEAWIFNYVFDVDWTMLHFDPDIRSHVSVKIIHGSWKNEDQNKQGIDDACRRWPNVTAIQAYLPDTFGTHHTKMIVLFRHDDIAEIIIHTANMQAGDWTHATQAVWRTLPLQKGGSSVDDVSPQDLRIGSGERFRWDFLRYLKAYGKKLGSLVEEISQYDFSTYPGTTGWINTFQDHECVRGRGQNKMLGSPSHPPCSDAAKAANINTERIVHFNPLKASSHRRPMFIGCDSQSWLAPRYTLKSIQSHAAKHKAHPIDCIPNSSGSCRITCWI